jgi:hypothetical protein
VHYSDHDALLAVLSAELSVEEIRAFRKLDLFLSSGEETTQLCPLETAQIQTQLLKRLEQATLQKGEFFVLKVLHQAFQKIQSLTTV